MARITNAELQTAFAALVHAEGHAGITRKIYLDRRDREEIGTTDEYYIATSLDLIFEQGSATYGNAYGVFYSPWHGVGPARHKALSGHYESGIGRLSTDRRETLVRMRAYTAGVYAAMRAQSEVTA